MHRSGLGARFFFLTSARLREPRRWEPSTLRFSPRPLPHRERFPVVGALRDPAAGSVEALREVRAGGAEDEFAVGVEIDPCPA